MLNFKIIAVDFDGTLCENKWPEIGEPNNWVINYLKKEKEGGAKIILWTCRIGDLLKKAVDWCDRYHQLQFDMINSNLPEVVTEFGGDTRKIFANEYIDDKMCDKFNLPYPKEEKQMIEGKPLTPIFDIEDVWRNLSNICGTDGNITAPRLHTMDL